MAGEKENKGSTSSQPVAENVVIDSARTTHGWRFWGTLSALCVLSFVSALDVAVITTARPTITKDIGGERHYVWIANSFVLACAVPQPLFAQISNIFGRRIPLLVSTSLFAVGSGIAGGANGPAMLITGRSIQGVGAGGNGVLVEIICCDLVPLRERGKYLGIIFAGAGLGVALGPVLGGALAEADWRWIFYMNIPICGIALGMVLLFFRGKYLRSPTGKHAVGRIDWVGNVMFCPSLVGVLYGLVSGGTLYPWSSWRVIVPLVLGLVGWVSFHAYETSPWCDQPSVPTRLFSNLSPELQTTLANGAAYAYAINQYIDPIGSKFKDEIIEVYIRSLKCVWWMGLAFSLLGLVGVIIERGIELRKDRNTAYGLEKD